MSMASSSRKRKGGGGGRVGGVRGVDVDENAEALKAAKRDRRLVERGSWNTLAVETNLLKDFGVGGVALIEELTDYDMEGGGGAAGASVGEGERRKETRGRSGEENAPETEKKKKKTKKKVEASTTTTTTTSTTSTTSKPIRGKKGKLITVQSSNESGKSSAPAIEDLNEPSSRHFDATPGKMIAKIKTNRDDGEETNNNINDNNNNGNNNGEKKKRLGSKRRKAKLSKRQRRKLARKSDDGGGKEGEEEEEKMEEDDETGDDIVGNRKKKKRPEEEKSVSWRKQDRKRKAVMKKLNDKSELEEEEKKNVAAASTGDGKSRREEDRIGNRSDDPPDSAVDVSAWKGLFVPPPILRALAELNFASPTPIQTLTLPAAIRDKRDVIGAAETGSGKTLCFGIPALALILKKRAGGRDGKAAEGSDEMKEEEEDDDEGEEEEEDEDEETEEFFEDNEEELEIEEVDEEEMEKPGSIEDGSLEVETEKVGVGGENGEKDDDEDGDEVDGNRSAASLAEGEGRIDDDDEKDEGESDVDDDDHDDGEEREKEKDLEEDEGDDDDEEEEEEEGNDEEFDLPPMRDELPKADAPYENPPIALVLTPTRELAIQVANHIKAAAKYCDVNVVTVVGGMAQQKQQRMLKRKPEIVVATPGRLWELMKVEDHLDAISHCDMLVIDETDRMIERGHFEELSSIIHHMNKEGKRRQTLIFSATMTFVHSGPHRSIKKRVQMTVDSKLDKLIKEVGLSKKPAVVDLSRKEGTAEKLVETRLNCAMDEKDHYLFYFLKQYPGRTIVFCNSINCIRRLISLFAMLQCAPLPLHASMAQRQRLKNVERFSNKENSLLIASDVAARGLDIPNVQHVVHYQVPRTSENYIHRSGRTARADKQGVSVLLVSPQEMTMYQRICHNLNKSEHLPLFPVETKYLPGIKRRVELARDIETADYRMKKEFRYLDWFETQAKEADLDFDLAENHLAAEDEDQVSKRKKKKENREEEEKKNDGRRRKNQMEKELGGLKAELKNLLSKPIFPTGFSGRYLTKEGAFNVPSLLTNNNDNGRSFSQQTANQVANNDNNDDDAKSAVEMAKKEIAKLRKLKASNPVVTAAKDNERTKARKKAKQKAKDERKKRNKELKGGGGGGGKKEVAVGSGGDGGVGNGELMDDGYPKPTFTFE